MAKVILTRQQSNTYVDKKCVEETSTVQQLIRLYCVDVSYKADGFKKKTFSPEYRNGPSGVVAWWRGVGERIRRSIRLHSAPADRPCWNRKTSLNASRIYETRVFSPFTKKDLIRIKNFETRQLIESSSPFFYEHQCVG